MRRHTIDNDALPIATQLAVAGCRCVVHTNTESVIFSLRKWRTTEAVGFENQFELAVLVDDGPQRQETLPQFRGRGQFVFATFHGTEMFVFDLLRRRITAVVSEETARDNRFWEAVLIPIAMGVMGPMLGVAPLHSACLETGGRGMLLAGVSGAGKSTLATALAMEGMALVSDDWIYASEKNGLATVHGLGVPVKLMPDTARYFDQLRGEEPRVSLNGELAYEVDARMLGIKVSGSCEPECIVFLERAEGKSRITPVEASRAREFFEGSAEPLPLEFGEAADGRRRIIQAVVERDCWHFRYGGTPRDGARKLRRFFEETYDVERACASAS
jgi:hypothetical protein